MSKYFLFVLFLMPLSLVAQRTLIADDAEIKDSINLAGEWISKIRKDTAFWASTHGEVPSTRAILEWFGAQSAGIPGTGQENHLTYWDSDSTLNYADITYSPTILDASGLTGALRLPSGSDAQDPVWQNGMLRYNTTTEGIQGYNGAERYLPWADADNWTSGQIPYSNGSALTSSSNLIYTGGWLYSATAIKAGGLNSESTGVELYNSGQRSVIYGETSLTSDQGLMVQSEKSLYLNTGSGYNIVFGPGAGTGTGQTVISSNQLELDGDGANNINDYPTSQMGKIVVYSDPGGWISKVAPLLLKPATPQSTNSSGTGEVIGGDVFITATNGLRGGRNGNVLLMQEGTTTRSGYVGIRTYQPTAYFDVNGNARIRTLPDSVAAYVATADASGYLYRATAADIVEAGGIASGAVSTSTDGSGDVVVSHGLGGTPTSVNVTISGKTAYIVTVHSVDGTNFTIRFFDTSGSAVASTAVAASWIAHL